MKRSTFAKFALLTVTASMAFFSSTSFAKEGGGGHEGGHSMGGHDEMRGHDSMKGHESMGHMDQRGMEGKDFDPMHGNLNHDARNFDHQYNNGGYFEGSYGVYGPNEYISPTPPPGSQPGMNDDSNALYNSYMKSNQHGH